jgi:CDP-diacylglycerol--glycerol-3-phosphate 3-phosphatidyltransferase
MNLNMNLKKLNTAESFAASRIVSFPLVLIFILLEERQIAAWLYIILFSTDFIDGFFAFFYNQESSRRAKLDSLGDFLFLITGLIGFYIFETEFFHQYIIPISIVLGLYALQCLIAFIKWGRPSSFHTYSAKFAAITQVIFIAFSLMFEASPVLFYFTVVFSTIDIMEDIILTFLLPTWQANVKGLLWLEKNNDSKKEKASRKRF